ncbi:hypothetical protein CEB3_c04840 [Peptococcaceae bacterium CEB3]|nr:hypothetical protein CEB3_c04840 [Peptococcaceae bacterium CEB3]
MDDIEDENIDELTAGPLVCGMKSVLWQLGLREIRCGIERF